jgi:hypothetical protein
MNKFSTRSKKKLNECHPKLREVFNEVIKRSPVDFGISEGYRPPKKQLEYFCQGRLDDKNIITYMDGFNKKGKHNRKPSLAVDVFAWVDDSISYQHEHMKSIADTVKEVAREKGISIVWGGDWRWKDEPHFELK